MCEKLDTIKELNIIRGEYILKVKNPNNETVKVLCESLKELMINRKIEKISVRDIAHKANIHRITFYYYFEDKYELLHYIFHEDMKRIIKDCRGGDISHFIIGVFEYLEKNERIYNNAFASDDYQSLRGVYLRESKEYFEGLIQSMGDWNRMMVKKEYLVDFYSNAASSFIINWLKDANRECYEEAANQMVTMIEHGFMKCIGR